MVTEKSCNLSEKRLDLPWEKGSGSESNLNQFWRTSTKVIPIEKT